MQNFAGRRTLVCPWVEVRKRTLHTNSSILLQQFLAYLVRIIWMIYEMRGRMLYNSCFMDYYFRDLFEKKEVFCVVVILLWYIESEVWTHTQPGRNPLFFHWINQKKRNETNGRQPIHITFSKITKVSFRRKLSHFFSFARRCFKHGIFFLRKYELVRLFYF